MKEVQVLLSSYNGEKYIRKQLDSILAQENVAVKLFVRDDGSTDKTVEILKAYEEANDNIRVLYGENLGVIHSFFALIEEAEEAEFTAFADQDDVWLPEKLFRAVSALEEQKSELPLVYCSAKQLVDEQLQPLRSGICYGTVTPDFGNALVENMCTGCTCVINREMLQLLKGRTPDFTVMHDFWIYLVGSCFGRVLYDKESYILYRQHSGNELGAASSLLENYRRRIKNFKKHRGQLTRQAKELLRLYEKELSRDDKKLTANRALAAELVQAKKDKKIRRKLVKEGKVFRQRKSDDGIMKVLILLGLL